MARRRKFPRTMPVQERSRQSVEFIVDAGLQILEQEGPAALTTRRIADRAGVSVGGLYRYFENAEDVLHAVYKRQADEDIEFLERLLRSHRFRPIHEAVAAVVRTYVDRHRMTARLPGFSPENIALWGFASYATGASDRAEDVLREHLLERAHELRVADVGVAAFILLAGISGLLKTAIARWPELLERESFTQELVDVAVRYLAREQDERTEDDPLPSCRGADGEAQ